MSARAAAAVVLLLSSSALAAPESDSTGETASESAVSGQEDGLDELPQLRTRLRGPSDRIAPASSAAFRNLKDRSVVTPKSEDLFAGSAPRRLTDVKIEGNVPTRYAVQRALAGVRDAVRAKHPRLRGTVRVRFLVGEGGELISLYVLSKSRRLERLVRRELEGRPVSASLSGRFVNSRIVFSRPAKRRAKSATVVSAAARRPAPRRGK